MDDETNVNVLPTTAPEDTSEFSEQPEADVVAPVAATEDLSQNAVVDSTLAEEDIQSNVDKAEGQISQSEAALNTTTEAPTVDSGIYEQQQLENLDARASATVRSNDAFVESLNGNITKLEQRIAKGFADAPQVKRLEEEYIKAATAMTRDNDEILADTQNTLYNRGSFRYQSEAATNIFAEEVKDGEERLDELEQLYDDKILEMKLALEADAAEDLRGIQKEISSIQSESNDLLKEQFNRVRTFNNDQLDRKKDALSIEATTVDIYNSVAESLAPALLQQNLTTQELEGVAEANGIPLPVLISKLKDRKMLEDEFNLDQQNTRSQINSRNLRDRLSTHRAQAGSSSEGIGQYRLALSDSGIDTSGLSDKELIDIRAREDANVGNKINQSGEQIITDAIELYAKEDGAKLTPKIEQDYKNKLARIEQEYEDMPLSVRRSAGARAQLRKDKQAAEQARNFNLELASSAQARIQSGTITGDEEFLQPYIDIAIDKFEFDARSDYRTRSKNSYSGVDGGTTLNLSGVSGGEVKL